MVTSRLNSKSVALKLHVASLQLVITALKCHKDDKNIQVTGSAALFYLTNSEYRMEQSVKLRRQVIQVVLNGMESYQEVTVRVAQPPSAPTSSLSVLSLQPAVRIGSSKPPGPEPRQTPKEVLPRSAPCLYSAMKLHAGFLLSMQCSPEQREENDDSKAPFYLMVVVKGCIGHTA